MKMTCSEDYLKELEVMLQTISTQRSNIADTRKELGVLNSKIIDIGFKVALREGDFLLSKIENEHCEIIKIINKKRDHTA
jgi:hypothetical protein